MARNPYWEDTIFSEAVVDNGDNLVSLVGGLSEDERRGMTIVRTLISLYGSPSVTSGVVGSMSLMAGIGVVNQQAFSAGTGSLPDPEINSERPPRGWIWKDAMGIMDDATTAQPLSVVKADIRSKRKVDAGIAYLHLANASRTGTDFTIRVTGLIRILYLMA